MFILWYPIVFSRLHNGHRYVLEHSLILSHLIWGEFSAFSADNAIHSSQFFVPPGTHNCWVDRGVMIWKACPIPLHMPGSMTRAPITLPGTNQAWRWSTSVIWRELVTLWQSNFSWPKGMFAMPHCWSTTCLWGSSKKLIYSALHLKMEI